MAPLTGPLAAAALAFARPSAPDPVEQWRPLIGEASHRFAMPEQWIADVIRAESGGHASLDGRPVVSSAGAMGLMQLMPATWREMRAALGLGRDPFDPHDNIIAGTAYLRAMYEGFGYPGLFAAYNAGPGHFSAYLAGGRALPSETRAYVARLAGGAPRSAGRSGPDAAIFAVRAGGARPIPAAAPLPAAAAGGLFVRLGEAGRSETGGE